MKSIKEVIETPIKYDCDVLVAGGGVAGISAAIAAARRGARVILTDRGFKRFCFDGHILASKSSSLTGCENSY